MNKTWRVAFTVAVLGMAGMVTWLSAAEADFILLHGRIVTVDRAFSTNRDYDR